MIRMELLRAGRMLCRIIRASFQRNALKELNRRDSNPTNRLIPDPVNADSGCWASSVSDSARLQLELRSKFDRAMPADRI